MVMVLMAEQGAVQLDSLTGLIQHSSAGIGGSAAGVLDGTDGTEFGKYGTGAGGGVASLTTNAVVAVMANADQVVEVVALPAII